MDGYSRICFCFCFLLMVPGDTKSEPHRRFIEVCVTHERIWDVSWWARPRISFLTRSWSGFCNILTRGLQKYFRFYSDFTKIFLRENLAKLPLKTKISVFFESRSLQTTVTCKEWTFSHTLISSLNFLKSFTKLDLLTLEFIQIFMSDWIVLCNLWSNYSANHSKKLL